MHVLHVKNPSLNKDIRVTYRSIKTNNGTCHIGAIVENSGPYRIYIHYIHIPEYISISQGYQRSQNFNNLHKRVYGPIEREMNNCVCP